MLSVLQILKKLEIEKIERNTISEFCLLFHGLKAELQLTILVSESN